MSLESFNYIDSLNAANPTTTDNVSEGDDHIRGIKTTLKNTFPNINAAVTATDEELNYVDGVTSAIQTQLGAKLPLAGGTMTGNLSLGDNVKATFGASDDLQIYHDSATAQSIISEEGGGSFILKGTDVYIQTATGENSLFADTNGAVNLYYDNSLKLATSNTGVDVTGSVTCGDINTSGELNLNAASNNYIDYTDALHIRAAGSSPAYEDSIYCAKDSQVEIKHNGSTKLATTSTGIDVTGDITCNNITITDDMGHIGDSDTYFSFEGNTLNLYTGGSNTVTGANGVASLLNAGNTKLVTTNTGVDITGSVTCDGATVTGTLGSLYLQSSGAELHLSRNGNNDILANGGTSADLTIGANRKLIWKTGSTLTERMRIDSTGNVGIGVTPESWNTYTAVQIGGMGSLFGYTASAGSDFSMANNTYYNSGYKYIFADEATQYQQVNGKHVFYVAPSGTADSAISWTSAMTINNSGNVGFGVASPTVRIHLNGGTPTNANTGIAAAWNVHSDYRMKENIVPLTDATERLKKLKPCRFNWNFEEDTPAVDGFLAHEAQEVVPEAVSGEKDGMRTEEYEVTPEVKETITIPAVEAVEATYDDEDNILTEAVEAQEERTEERVVTKAVMGEREVEDYQGIDQAKLVPLLVSALQEAVARIEQLENA